MSGSVYSTLWYRVAGRKPRLAAHVRVERQICRDQVWYLLVDDGSGRSVRLNAAAYGFAGRLNGAHTVQQAWDLTERVHGDGAPTQDEAIQLLAQLQERRLLQLDAAADFEGLFRQWARNDARAVRRRLNPLALRLNFGNPRAVLAPLEGMGAWLFRWPLLWLWLACVGAGLLAAVAHWDALAAHGAKWMGTSSYVLLALAVYPVIKAIHELAHGLAVRRWGGEVSTVGVTLLVLLPVPFVDASAASAFRHTYQRVMVSAAGIMAELLIAALALAVWLNVQPGLIRDLAFVAAFIGGVSTVLFNGNPLLRFDGYFVLTDLLGLPNLASRSTRWWGETLQRSVLRIPVNSPLLPASGELGWLIAYAPLSWTYRAGLCIAIATWVGGFSALLGVVVGSGLAIALLAPPVRALKRFVTGAGLDPNHRMRALAGSGVAFGALALVLCALPMPFSAVSQGVVWVPDDARLRAQSEGFVREIRALDGARVRQGEVVLVLSNPRLEAERDQLKARVARLEPELFHLLRSDASRAASVREELEQLRAELARSEERLAGLTLTAGVSGTLVMPRPEDLPGTFAAKGAVLGHVLPDAAAIIRVAVPEEEAALVGTRTRRVAVRLAEAPAASLDAALLRDSRAGTGLLPSAALSTRHGGSVRTDPDDKSGLTPLSPVVLMDVRLPSGGHEHIGTRAWVRFDYGASPLAEQWARRVRQVLLRHFNPAT